MAQSRNEELLKSIGKRICLLRDMKGWSQIQLAKAAGLSKNYISDVETGRRNTSITNLNKIAEALDKSLSDLLKSSEY